jgi:cytochrome c biogenesis protein
MAEALRRARYGVAVDAVSPTRTRILARRWSFAAYGGIVTHVAIFLVALGAVLGCLPWTSLDERLTLTEGETREVSDRDLPLPFPVRLDDFRMEYYPETGAPSSYESDITLFAGETAVKTDTATVNSQVRDRGVSFGQSEWGISGVRVAVRSGPNSEEEITFPIAEAAGHHGGSSWTLDEQGCVAFLDGNTSALVAEYFVADAFEREGEIVGSASHYPRRPAVLLTVVSGLDSGEHEFHSLGWLRPDGELTHQGYVIRFDDIVYNSTLSVRKDPGLLLVWVGFVLISLGMIVAFYVQPRSFLVEVDSPADGRPTRLRVAPAGRQLLEADRRAIEARCAVTLVPLAAQTGRTGARQQRSQSRTE